jgi:polygalacturonase
MPYKNINRSLIYAVDCTDVSITGQGTINGGAAEMSVIWKQKHGDNWWGIAAENLERTVLVRFRNCTNTRIENVLLTNSLSFNFHPIKCREMNITGLRIESVIMPNSDGIDLDGCQDVFISNCNINCEDDAIALKVMEFGSPCKDIVITNCILSTWCAAFRAGPDAVEDIENVTMTNCVIRNTSLNGIKIQEAMGTVMRNMTFSNIVMDNVKGPISIRLAGWKQGVGNVWSVFDDSNWPNGKVQNILFDNIRGKAVKDNICMSITGTAQTKPEQIMFSNIDITFIGGGTAEQGSRRDVPDLERKYPEIDMFGELPAYGLYIHHAKGIVFNNVRFRLENPDLRPAIVCDDVQDLELTGFRADGNKKAESLIRVQNSQDVLIKNSRPLNETGTVLLVEGADSKNIRSDE